MRINSVACLSFLLLGTSAFAQLSRRDLEDIERHRGESREMSVVVETWDFLDVDEEEATPEEIDVGAGAVLEYFWESPDSLLATMVADYIARHKKGLRIVLERYESYEVELRAVFERKGLPEDLTLLAAVESAMNPRALSKAGARGMWQLMPAPGHLLVQLRVCRRRSGDHSCWLPGVLGHLPFSPVRNSGVFPCFRGDPFCVSLHWIVP